MKTVIGIISIVLSLLVGFQSCAVSLGNSMVESSDTSGFSGILLTMAMMIAGFLILLSKDKKGIIITSIVFYVVGGLIGFTSKGDFGDLAIWSNASFIFAGLTIFYLIRINKKSKINESH